MRAICFFLFFACLLLLAAVSCSHTQNTTAGGNDSLSSLANNATGHDKPKGGHSLQNDLNSPYYHSIYYATSVNGIVWEKKSLLFEHASVPGAVVLGSNIYLYFIDASQGQESLMVGISADNGKTFAKQAVAIEGLNPGDAVDPHPELLANGHVRLYYFCSLLSKVCYQKTDNPNPQRNYYFAESEDGVYFSNATEVYEDSGISDPDVFFMDSQWHILATKEGYFDHLISRDNGLSFSFVKEYRQMGVVCDTFDFSGVFRTYCNEGRDIISNIWQRGSLVREPGIQLEADSETIGVGDPSVIKIGNDYIMYYKTYNLQVAPPQNSAKPSNCEQPTTGQ